jgi:anti-sigma B factor antagonist
VTPPPHAHLSLVADQDHDGPAPPSVELKREGLLLIRTRDDGGHWTLALYGELDIASAGALEEELRRAETLADTVTVDLGGLRFIDSSGLHVISSAHQRTALSGRLCLRRGSHAVQTVFRVTGNEDALPFER